MLVDPSGLAWWRKAYKVCQYTADGGRRLIAKARGGKGVGNKKKRLKQIEDHVNEAAYRPVPDGTSPRRGWGIEFEGSTRKDRNDAAAHFSPDGRSVDHGDHSHTNAGDFAELDFRHDGQRGHFYDFAGGLLLSTLAPNAVELVQLKQAHPEADINLGNLFAAGAFDILNTIDPFGISDLVLFSEEAGGCP